jgi:hypothetical protein
MRKAGSAPGFGESIFNMRRIAIFLGAALAASAAADTLELHNGTILRDCFIRDEGVRLLVWESFEKVGTFQYLTIPRSQVKSFKIERDDPRWDVQPKLPDLSVIFIEMNPKLPGLHGRVSYDQFGRPWITGSPLFADLGEKNFSNPQGVVRGVAFNYRRGQEITLSANVKNVGFAPAQPFTVVWEIGGVAVARQEHRRPLEPEQIAVFHHRIRWDNERRHVTVRVETAQPEISKINNEATDPLWGWGLTYIVHHGRVKAWKEARTAYGTFSFEDFYRWHIDIMNLLFANSIWPSAPEGIIARVRLDKIIYTDDVEAEAAKWGPNELRFDQGRWIWIDDEDRKREWKPATKEWRNQTEWSLPHELGHQLGLVDWYNLDYPGTDRHSWADTGEKVAHFMTHPEQMMHWHGPHVFGEADAGYLNLSWDKPRGHFGDIYFAIPRDNFLRIVDINGIGMPAARVEVFQRGVQVDKNAVPGEEWGVRYWQTVEDGNFDHPMSADPVIAGETDRFGMLRLPNRPVHPVRTLNGFERRANPFGNINVVGNRGLMYVRVTVGGRESWFSLEAHDFIVHWLRGGRDRYEIVLQTPNGSLDSPPPVTSLTLRREGETVHLSWQAPQVRREASYGEKITGYRIYRRVSSDTLNTRPWFPVATLPADARGTTVDLSAMPQEIYWFGRTQRIGITAIGERGRESELVERALPPEEADR